MGSKRNNRWGVVCLVIIIIILVVLCILFATDTIIINNKVEVNNTSDNTNENVDGNVLTNEEAISIGKNLYDKATEIYSTWVLRPYCGYNSIEIEQVEAEELGNSDIGNGRYYKSDFRTLNELKDYLMTYLSKEIVDAKVYESSEWNGEIYYNYVTDISLLSTNDTHYGYIDYVLKDDSIYCRLDTGKGWLSYYLGIYEISPKTIEEDRIVYEILSLYAKEIASEKCQNAVWDGNLDYCKDDEIEKRTTQFIIEKTNNNWVVTSYILHD